MRWPRIFWEKSSGSPAGVVPRGLWRPRPTGDHGTGPRMPGGERPPQRADVWRPRHRLHLPLLRTASDVQRRHGPHGVAAAVLIRGVEPVEGHGEMARRRKYPLGDFRIGGGPGALSQALGIRMRWNGCDLVSGPIRIEDDGMRLRNTQVRRGRRVGVNYAGPAARFLWRFSIRDNPWVSRAKA